MPGNTASAYSFPGLLGVSGFSGYSGYSGLSGNLTASGYSGLSGFSGFSGYSGGTGAAGPQGISGYSGFQGSQGSLNGTYNQLLSTNNSVTFASVSAVSAIATSILAVSAINTVGLTPYQQNQNNILAWIEIPPAYTEYNYVNGVNLQITLNGAIPSNARYVLLDFFFDDSGSDQQNWSLGRGNMGNVQRWMGTAGAQPSTNGVNSNFAQTQMVVLQQWGETDGYWMQGGWWYSSLAVPCASNQIYVSNYGNSNTNGWIAFVVKAYSL